MSEDYAPFVRSELPNGCEVFFRDSDHSYHGEIRMKNGKWTAVKDSRLVSVTTALKALGKGDGLLDWAARCEREGKNWRDVRGEAGSRGTDSHDLILRTLLHERTSLADLKEEVRPYGQAAFKWLRDRKPKVIQAETFVASFAYGYAGRFDLLALIDEKRTRIDFKTVTKWSYKKNKDGKETDRLNPPFTENLLQLDLYEHAAVESAYDSSQRGLIVRLGPDGNYDETFVDLDIERGIRALSAYRSKQEADRVLRAAVKVPKADLAVAA